MGREFMSENSFKTDFINDDIPNEALIDVIGWSKPGCPIKLFGPIIAGQAPHRHFCKSQLHEAIPGG